MTQDPIGLVGAFNLYAYPTSPLGTYDPMGLAPEGTYYCKRPVDGKPGDELKNFGLAHHYICSVGADGSESCRGLTHANPAEVVYPLYPYPGTIAGQDRGDYFHPNACSQIDVFPSCGAKKLEEIASRSAPVFGVGPLLTDCQEWADDTAAELQQACPVKIPIPRYQKCGESLVAGGGHCVK